MTFNNEIIKQWIKAQEGVSTLLYADSKNPYESINVYAYFNSSELIIKLRELEKEPNGLLIIHSLVFDKTNTLKVINVLFERGNNPYQVLNDIYSKAHLEGLKKLCDSELIIYKETITNK